MARPREFDIMKAREDAMQVFWEGGYAKTSLPNLLDGLSLSRGSLYKAFGSKKSLFLEALNLYDQSVLQPGIQRLKDSSISTGRKRIEGFFNGAIVCVEAGDRRGCLLCNAAVGAAHDDDDIRTVVGRMLGDLTNGFVSALADVPSSRKLDEAGIVDQARGLTMSYVGLRVLARSGAGVAQLKGAVSASLRF